MHLLLTVLGQGSKPARYTLNDRETTAPLAPVALLRLLPPESRPQQVLALCTPEAEKTNWPVLERELDRGISAKKVIVPSGLAAEDIEKYLRLVCDELQSDEYTTITVDITHGYRHFSFLTYTAVLYFSTLRAVKIRAAYYALLRQDQPSPFFDLRPLLELPVWFHALRVLEETGSTVPIARQLGIRSSDQNTQDIAKHLQQVSEAYLSGLPLELGREIRLFRKQKIKPLRRLLEEEHHLPLADRLVSKLKDIFAPYELAASGSSKGWKRGVELSGEELGRQATLIRDLLRHGNAATALGLMDEWVVSWVVWRQGWKMNWLDYQGTRRRAARRLDALAVMKGDSQLVGLLTKEQRELATFWTDLLDLRNTFHHHGFRKKALVGDKKVDRQRETVRDYWEKTLSRLPEIPLTPEERRYKTTLVSPIGKSPGVLYSALMLSNQEQGRMPDLCLVICSNETDPLVEEATRRAGYTGEVKHLPLEDPFAGSAQIQRLVHDVRLDLISTGDVLVNITGGTTLMALAAQAVAEEARGLGRSMRRFGLIDRRSHEKQQEDPYRISDVFWLDPREESDGDEDN